MFLGRVGAQPRSLIWYNVTVPGHGPAPIEHSYLTLYGSCTVNLFNVHVKNIKVVIFNIGGRWYWDHSKNPISIKTNMISALIMSPIQHSILAERLPLAAHEFKNSPFFFPPTLTHTKNTDVNLRFALSTFWCRLGHLRCKRAKFDTNLSSYKRNLYFVKFV